MQLNIDHLTEAELIELIELNHKIVERLRLMRQIRSHKEIQDRSGEFSDA